VSADAEASQFNQTSAESRLEVSISCFSHVMKNNTRPARVQYHTIAWPKSHLKSEGLSGLKALREGRLMEADCPDDRLDRGIYLLLAELAAQE
jgi:hypothetical protein